MRTTVSLDGDWERRDFLDEASRWSDALRPSGAAAGGGPPAKPGVSAGWRPARVPGSLIDDAWRAGEIPNPYLDRHSLAAEWIPQRTWLYRRRFTVPPEAGPRAVIRFEGIDPGGIVILDGTELARHEGMFAPLEVHLGTVLEPGSSHDLLVVVDPAPPMPSQVARTDQARLLRSRMGYGWDFCPRMIHTGIWRPVRLELFDTRIGRARVDARLDEDLRAASVEVTAFVDGGGTVVATVLAPDGATLAEGRAASAADGVTIRLELDGPRAWWPNGSGEAALHRLRLRLEDGAVLDERIVPIGFRSLELVPTEGAPADALPYAVVANGRLTPIRGWNWTPIDALFGVPRPAKLRHFVELLQRARVNLVRVWGGGLLESEDFYAACDGAGIMVWQEFAQSSSGVANTPADDPAFVAHARREAERLVPLRAHHASLAIWCGGNELAWPDGRPLTDAHPVLAALRDAVRRLDPDAAWLPTSPSGPRFDNSLAAIAEDADSLHDVHGPWEHQGLAEQHELANATTNLLHSEFGVEGMTNLATLRATVTEPMRWSADRTDPVLAHRGAWWNNVPFVERAFGGHLALEELERASQHLQADGLRTLMEGDRRRARNAGTLPWVFNEPFPNAWSNAAVDYFGRPKAAYHAVAAAYRPVLVGLSFESQALDGATELAVTPWAVADDPVAEPSRVDVALYDAGGRRLHEARTAVGGAGRVTLRVPPDAADLLVLDASAGEHRARYLLSRTATLEPMRRLPPAAIEAQVAAAGDGWMVALRNIGEIVAPELRLDDARPVGWPEPEGAPYPSANLVTLLPGESATIAIEWRDVPPADRGLRLSGWNVREWVLDGG